MNSEFKTGCDGHTRVTLSVSRHKPANRVHVKKTTPTPTPSTTLTTSTTPQEEAEVILVRAHAPNNHARTSFLRSASPVTTLPLSLLFIMSYFLIGWTWPNFRPNSSARKNPSCGTRRAQSYTAIISRISRNCQEEYTYGNPYLWAILKKIQNRILIIYLFIWLVSSTQWWA